jgi:PAS domain S-box-containing protein
MPKRTSILTAAGAVSALLLLALVGFLLVNNYRSQVSLRSTLLERFSAENERLARELMVFFNNRKEELFALSASRAIEVLHEHRARGGKRGQDLRTVVAPVTERFSVLMERNRIGIDGPYERIMLIDEAGRVLVDVGAPDARERRSVVPAALREPRHRETAVLAQDGGGEVLLSRACYFKGRYAGQILAWVRTQFLFDYVLRHPANAAYRTVLLYGSEVIEGQEAGGRVPALPFDEIDAPREFPATGRDGVRQQLVAVKNLVLNSPFTLMTVAPARDVTGRLDPRSLLITMAVLAAAIIGSAVAVSRQYLRSLVLKARLDESLRHEQEVWEKNQQLEREIAERRQAVDALRRSEEQYRALVETSLDIIYANDGNGMVRSLNSAFERITGWKREDWTGRPFAEILHPEDRQQALQIFQEVLQGRQRSGHVLRCRTAGGDYRIAEFSSAPLMRDGQIVGTFGVARDITDRKQLEEQLRHAAKMEAVGQLAGGIAHDFNNMLSVVIGYGNLLLEELPPDDVLRSQVNLILASAERAARLTQNLLAFSRKQVIAPKPLDLVSLLEGMEPLLARLVGEDVLLTLRLPAERLTIMADSTQVEQIFMNLAANARDAMPRGGRLVIAAGGAVIDRQFRARHGFGKPGPYAVVTVEDSGTGIPADVRERIFEPFFTTKGTGRGTGLGLSIVFGIIKQHYGYIDLSSEAGTGTVFTVYLPLLPDRDAVAEAVRQQESPSGGTETILLAEDNAEVRAMLARVLREAGYRVIESADGEDALERFREQGGGIDLLLFDVIMPNRSGKEAYDAIRALQPEVKVLFISGYAGDLLGKSGISDQEFNFLAKPVHPREVLAKVRGVLDQ